MATKDWRSGTLVGSGYAYVVDGKALLTHRDRSKLIEILESAASTAGMPLSVVAPKVKQVCIILPPWEESKNV